MNNSELKDILTKAFQEVKKEIFEVITVDQERCHDCRQNLKKEIKKLQSYMKEGLFLHLRKEEDDDEARNIFITNNPHTTQKTMEKHEELESSLFYWTLPRNHTLDDLVYTYQIAYDQNLIKKEQISKHIWSLMQEEDKNDKRFPSCLNQMIGDIE